MEHCSPVGAAGRWPWPYDPTTPIHSGAGKDLDNHVDSWRQISQASFLSLGSSETLSLSSQANIELPRKKNARG